MIKNKDTGYMPVSLKIRKCNMFDNGSIFELIMLVCFGVSWPITIVKTIRSKTVKGVTPVFYILIFAGYTSGTIYKMFFNFDYVFLVYIFNLMAVSLQIFLYFYYSKMEKKG